MRGGDGYSEGLPVDLVTMEKTDILISGGGPVGLTVALELARFGLGVVLVNDGTETALHPKANAINARTMEHFRRHGVGPELRAAALPSHYPTDVCYVTRLTGQELARLHMPSSADAVAEAHAGTNIYDCAEPPHRCSQIYLESILREATLSRPGVDVRFGQRLESFRADEDGVVGVVRNLEDDSTYEVAALHLVGADGGRGAVRRQLGIRYLGDGGVTRKMMGGSMLATLFEVPSRKDWLTIDPAWQYWVIAADVRALLVTVDGENKFVMLTRIPDGIDPDDLDDHALLALAAGIPVEADILLRMPWTAGHELLAESFGGDRAWLVGDAAHLFTPTGGLGMNTGVDDAVNLAWKLAGDVQGWGGPNLMASYEADRRPIGARNLAFARSFADSIGTFDVDPCIEDDTESGVVERARLSMLLSDHVHREMIIPGITLGVRYDGSPLVSDDGSPPVPDEAGVYVPTARPGHRAPHVWLEGGDALCDRFSDGFTLLRTNSDIDAGPMISAARAVGLPIEILDIDSADVRQRYEAALVLIFPDGHIAWRGDACPVDARALIDRSRGAL
ncbi:MAG: FAD-dependent monooxygenase [Alphaproteobacteria bacterium]|nr:FAD-dependent monooxygenase [Alphaproteobacteria bacterium]